MKYSESIRSIFLKSLMTIFIASTLSACTKKTASGSDTNSTGLFPDSIKFAFSSMATNLIDGINTDGSAQHVYLKNSETGEVELVSKNKIGDPAIGYSYFPSQSGDGNIISFINYPGGANQNLIDGQTILRPQIYVKNMKTGDLVIASTSENGEPIGGDSNIDFFHKISADGNRVAFMSNSSTLTSTNPDGNWVTFVKDLTSGKIIRLDTLNDGTLGNGGFQSSAAPSLSMDGKKIAFSCVSSNLIPLDNKGNSDIYVKDFDTGELILVSASADGTPGNGNSYDASISGDGTLVLFGSNSTNLTSDSLQNATAYHLYLKNIKTGEITLIENGDNNSMLGALSLDGSKVSFFSTSTDFIENDQNGSTGDLYLKDLVTGKVTLLSERADGSQSLWGDYYLPLFSADGNKVYFQTTSALVSEDEESSSTSSWFQSDVYLKNLTDGKLKLISTNASGIKGNNRNRFDNNW